MVKTAEQTGESGSCAKHSVTVPQIPAEQGRQLITSSFHRNFLLFNSTLALLSPPPPLPICPPASSFICGLRVRKIQARSWQSIG